MNRPGVTEAELEAATDMALRWGKHSMQHLRETIGEERSKKMTDEEWDEFVVDMVLISMGVLDCG